MVKRKDIEDEIEYAQLETQNYNAQRSDNDLLVLGQLSEGSSPIEGIEIPGDLQLKAAVLITDRNRAESEIERLTSSANCTSRKGLRSRAGHKKYMLERRRIIHANGSLYTFEDKLGELYSKWVNYLDKKLEELD